MTLEQSLYRLFCQLLNVLLLLFASLRRNLDGLSYEDCYR